MIKIEYDYGKLYAKLFKERYEYVKLVSCRTLHVCVVHEIRKLKSVENFVLYKNNHSMKWS